MKTFIKTKVEQKLRKIPVKTKLKQGDSLLLK